MTAHVPTRTIVVGVDESAGAADALRWAAAEAEVHHAELRAVMAWGLLDEHHVLVDEEFDPSYDQARAEEALRSYITAAVGAERGDSIDARVVCDVAPRALLDASRTADLLVVGARGLGGFRDLLLGSVSQHCLHHTTVPIAIVRNRFEDGHHDHEQVVVATDGSEPGQDAVRWAINEASARKARLDVVNAWQGSYLGYYPNIGRLFEDAVFERSARRLLHHSVAAEDTSAVSAGVREVALRGGAALAVLEHAAGADLLVVGSRGNGPFRRTLLGSVATQLSHHARCPLVVIPADPDRRP